MQTLIKILVIFFLFCSTAGAVDPIYKTVCPSGQGCDYTSLNSALTDNQQNLVSGDKYLDIEIKGSWTSEDSVATYDGYTTDSTHYVNIHTTGTARHSGKWTNTAYIIGLTANQTLIDNYRCNIRLDGIQVSRPAPTADDRPIFTDSGYCNDGDFLELSNSILKQTEATTNIVKGVMIKDKNVYLYLYNVIFDSFVDSNNSGYTTTIRNFTGSIKAYNCTFINNTRVYYSDTVTAKNSGQYNSTNSSNAYSETTCSSSSPTFVNVGGGDYHLDSSDTAWKDNGTDLSGESFPIIGSLTQDIDGTTRSGTWDIGADEYAAANSQVIIVEEE